MGYFPVYIKIESKKILIIGGGKIATDKLTRLLNFTNNITVLSENISKNMQKLIQNHNIPYINKKYQKEDISGFDIIISAIDNLELQKKIYEHSRGKNILVNSVDLIEYCDFIFPSYIKKGDLTISISTSGTSPAIAKYLKRFILKLLPEDLETFIKSMKECRNSLVKGEERMKILDKKAKEYFQNRDSKA